MGVGVSVSHLGGGGVAGGAVRGPRAARGRGAHPDALVAARRAPLPRSRDGAVRVRHQAGGSAAAPALRRVLPGRAVLRDLRPGGRVHLLLGGRGAAASAGSGTSSCSCSSLLLFAGLVYLWRVGGLDWGPRAGAARRRAPRRAPGRERGGAGRRPVKPRRGPDPSRTARALGRLLDVEGAPPGDADIPVVTSSLRAARRLGAQELPVAVRVRPQLLLRRDGDQPHGPLRHRPLRRRGAAHLAARGGRDDRRRHRVQEDGAGGRRSCTGR